MHKPKLNGGFFAAWIITFVVLYAVSYIWHGIFLNDLSRVSYPKNFFLFFVAVVYFIIAFIITFLTHFLNSLGKNKVKRGMLIGMPMGLFIYLISFVFGISFYSNPSLVHIVFDASWQTIEQGIGGLIAGAILSFSEVTSSKRAF